MLSHGKGANTDRAVFNLCDTIIKRTYKNALRRCRLRMPIPRDNLPLRLFLPPFTTRPLLVILSPAARVCIER